jgi:hypothetical protein
VGKIPNFRQELDLAYPRRHPGSCGSCISEGEPERNRAWCCEILKNNPCHIVRSKIYILSSKSHPQDASLGSSRAISINIPAPSPNLETHITFTMFQPGLVEQEMDELVDQPYDNLISQNPHQSVLDGYFSISADSGMNSVFTTHSQSEELNDAGLESPTSSSKSILSPNPQSNCGLVHPQLEKVTPPHLHLADRSFELIML